MKKHFARLLLPLGVLCAAAALLFYPTQAAAGAKRGIGYCVDILIPSLFPFMALSVFVVKSGLAASMGRLTAGPFCIFHTSFTNLRYTELNQEKGSGDYDKRSIGEH